MPQPGYVARIKFPPRRTADGSRISAMPVAEAERVLAELAGGLISGAAQPVAQVAVAPQAVAPPQAVATPQKVLTDWSAHPPSYKKLLLTKFEWEMV